MVNVTSSTDLQDRLAARRGYLANRDVDGRTYKVHDLVYFCNAKVEFTPEDYPKHWAENTDEFTQELGLEGVVWDMCGNCQRKRESAHRRAVS
jgi:hypothetical protein